MIPQTRQSLCLQYLVSVFDRCWYCCSIDVYFANDFRNRKIVNIPALKYSNTERHKSNTTHFYDKYFGNNGKQGAINYVLVDKWQTIPATLHRLMLNIFASSGHAHVKVLAVRRHVTAGTVLRTERTRTRVLLKGLEVRIIKTRTENQLAACIYLHTALFINILYPTHLSGFWTVRALSA